MTVGLDKQSVSFCIPITASTREELETEVHSIAAVKPELAEWRFDYYNESLIEALKILKELKKKGIELIFTPRITVEGGKKEMADDQRLLAIQEACRSGVFEYLDIERKGKKAFSDAVREIINSLPVRLIGSYHDFEKTPSEQVLTEELQDGASFSEIVKCAFACTNEDDLERLKTCGKWFSQTHQNPLILIAMGEKGQEGRIWPEILSSCLSFASGEEKTAPGQISLSEIRKIREEHA